MLTRENITDVGIGGGFATSFAWLDALNSGVQTFVLWAGAIVLVLRGIAIVRDLFKKGK